MHSKYRDFKRRTAEIETSKSQKEKVIYLKYLFDTSEHSVGSAPHGNRRKEAHLHLRTRPSTVEAIRKEVRKAELSRHPYKVYDKIWENAGGLYILRAKTTVCSP